MFVPPSRPPGLYEFVIPEDLPIGKTGGKVKANDRDIGDNAKSTYNIIEGDDRGVFEITTDTQTQEGILRLKKVGPVKFTYILPMAFWKDTKKVYTLVVKDIIKRKLKALLISTP